MGTILGGGVETRTRVRRGIAGALLLILTSASAWRSARADTVQSEERKVTQLAAGVYEIRHKDPSPGWTNGNTTVIIGEREVLVVDSGELSYVAQEDISQIRQWASKPVRYLVNTDWHQEHNGGNKDYMDAFPGLAILAHPETLSRIAEIGPMLPGAMLNDTAPTHEKLTHRLETGKTDDGQPLTEEQRKQTAARLAQLNQFMDAARTFSFQLPTLTFEHELVIDLGGREVRLMHPGRGNTAGDVVAYLPKEKILITGDLLVSPVPYGFSGYPVECIETLRKMDRLDADTIVPGHGDVMRDKAFLRLVIDTMTSVVEQVHEQIRVKGDPSFDEVKKSMDLKLFREKFARGDGNSARFFDVSVADKFVELAYYEAKQR